MKAKFNEDVSLEKKKSFLTFRLFYKSNDVENRTLNPVLKRHVMLLEERLAIRFALG